MKYKQPVSALVVIHTPQLDVLLLERAKHPGYWQSVTGSAEIGEAIADTARREVFEETGIDASRYPLDDWKRSSVWEIFLEWRFRYGPGVTHNEEHVFSLCVPEGMPVAISPTEHPPSCGSHGAKPPTNASRKPTGTRSSNFHSTSGYDGKEVKNIKDLGDFKTLRIVPDVVEGNVFKKGDHMTIWVSDDRNRIPLLIESPISVGSVKAVLKSHAGLRHKLDASI